MNFAHIPHLSHFFHFQDDYPYYELVKRIFRKAIEINDRLIAVYKIDNSKKLFEKFVGDPDSFYAELQDYNSTVSFEGWEVKRLIAHLKRIPSNDLLKFGQNIDRIQSSLSPQEIELFSQLRHKMDRVKIQNNMRGIAVKEFIILLKGIISYEHVSTNNEVSR
jgi:hypothetical protein